MSAVEVSPSRVGAPAPPRSRRVPGGVWALSVLGAGVAVLLALTAFRHGSVDNDDAVYLLQARLLAHGHLTGLMPPNPRASEPWFFAITAHGYVAKYLPVVALLYAAGLVLFGSVVPVLAALAFVLPLVTWGLARTAGLAPRRALAATAVVTLSPAVLIQGGLVLSYLPFLVLLICGWTLLLLVWRSGDRRAGGAFGVVAAVAACFRPLDPVLLLGPVALFVAWRLGRRAIAPVVAAVAGAAPIAVLVGVYDAHTTGSPLRLPFALLTPNDALGYGIRQLVPEDPRRHFGPLQGLYGGWLHFVAQPSGWMLGFLVVAPLALWNLRRGGAASQPIRLLASSVAVFAVVYLAFWGPWNTSVLWGGPDTVGPFYALPLLVPLALAAASWQPAVRRDRAFAIVVVLAVAALVGNVITVRNATEHNWQAAQRTTAVLSMMREAPGSLLVDLDPPYLAHPVGAAGDEPTGQGRPLLLATQLSATQVSTVADPTLLQVTSVYGTAGLDYRLVHEQRETGTSLPLHLSDYGTVGTATTLVVSRGGQLHACTFDGAIDLTLTADAVTGCTGRPLGGALGKALAKLPLRLCASADCVSYSLFRTATGSPVVATGWRMIRLALAGTQVTMLTDGAAIGARGSGWITVAAGAAAGV